MRTGPRLRRLPALLAAAALCLCAARASAGFGARTAHTTSLLPTGNVLTVGGIDAGGTFLATTALGLTAKDGSVVAGPSITVARASHTATVMGNGCVLIAGGVNSGGALSDARVYDPVSNTIINPGSSMSSARFNHTATLLNDGRVLLCGGESDTLGTVSQTCDLFTPTGTMGPGTCSGSFTGSVTMLHARTLHTAVLLQDGKVWFAGGWDGAGFTPTTEKYIPSPPAGVGSFSSASPLIQARSNHTATMMGDGRILVAGGYDGQDVLENRGILDTLEIYDPIANSTIPGPVLEARREQHTATLMDDGRVLLFGGLGNITTTYFTPNPALVFGGKKKNTSKINVAVGGAVTAGVPAPNLDLSLALGVPVVGTIEDGSILYSQPTTPPLSWGTLTYADPLVVNMQGFPVVCVGVGNCTITVTPFDLPGFAATATVNQVKGTLTPSANGGTINTSGGGTTIAAGSDASFGSATISSMSGLQSTQLDGTVNITAGTITSTSYTIDLTNGSLSFTNASVDSSQNLLLTAPNNDVTSLAGTVKYAALPGLGVTNDLVTSGVLHFTSSPLDGSAGHTSGSLNPGTDATFNMTLNLPSDLALATVTGVLTIQSGSIEGSTITKIVSLTGGSIPFTGTADATGQVTVNGVTASNLQGSISWLGGVQADGDAMSANDQITLSGVVTYTATGIHVTGEPMSLTSVVTITAATGVDITQAALNVGVSTAVVRSMVFGQGEYYNPRTNSVTFDPGFLGADVKFETFGQTATLLPPSDMLLVGGSDCSAAGCPGFAAIDRGLTYLMQQPANNFSATAGSLHTARALHTATLLNDGTILVAGGTNGLNLLTSAEIFNPANGQFATAAGSMSNPRDLHTATMMDDGRVLIAGGISTNALSTGSISAVDIYYPDTQLFIPTTPMAAARSNHTATLMPDGKVMVVGGFGAGDVITGTAEVFDPEHMTWTTVAPLPGGATAALHTATLLKDGRLMIAGGVSAAGVLNTVFAYDPGSGVWSTLAPMPSKLRSHTATLLMDGRVLVAGGNDGNGETASSYIYDPVADSWTNTSPSANALTVPRFGHTATLLPDGGVMISGGSNKFGAIPTITEVYHVDLSSWVPGTPFQSARAFHTMTLAPNGNVYAIGGSNGAIGGTGTSYLASGEQGAFSTTPDSNGKGAPAIASARQSSFTITSVAPLQTNEVLNLTGSKLLGGTEASGGGAASANSSFAVPHLILQKTDASDFIVDLTTDIFSAAAPPTNSALKATLPSAQALLPSGWYNARVGVNGVYSNGTFIQVGPAKPASAPTSLIGTAQGVSSITWTWDAVAGADGYDIYQASTNIFIATVAANSFIQTGLPANAIEQILVAGYTLSGDGPTAESPATAVSPITTVTSVVCGPNRSGASTTEIQWDWTQVSVADSYNVYNSTTGGLIANTSVPTFFDVGLGTNSERTIAVAAVTGGIEGPLSPPATCFTLAATPLPPLVSQNLALMTSTTPTSISLNWLANGNPDGTLYRSSFTSVQFLKTIISTGLAVTQDGLVPSNYYTAQVFALNRAGTASAPLLAGTTFTLPAPPASLSIHQTTPVSLALSWDTNSNSTMTVYQVVYDTVSDFTGTVTTAVPFSTGYGGSSVTITGLLTGLEYFVSVQAENPFGQTSITLSTDAITFNGGAPFGSLAGILTADGVSEFSGTIGAPIARTIDLRSPGGAFPVDTNVTVSTYSLLDHGGTLCPDGVPGVGGAGVVYSIVTDPQLQPTHPIFLSGSYVPSELGTAPVSQVALARFDPGSGTCVPLETLFETGTNTFRAQLNHFSLYQLVSVPLATSADTARLFPNPYRAATDGYVTIDQVPPAARVRVFTLRGERILDATASGAGNVTWRAENSAGRPVASGLYLVVIEAGGTKKIMKLAVIR